ncbi:hypothetical protein [Sneathiella glossodoripedis]|uniref:hypothetical protein n=1 Tax=Sneathiella glossodoripedis TaxID=418853 RepID=UPI00046F7F39|nr:hypothetical protein [Sneathiella glossodoripedis]
MADNKLPPPPRGLPPGLERWLVQVVVPRITKEAQLSWAQVAKAGSAIEDLDNTELLTNHINATESHGATGDLVGAEDYATTAKGGTVKKLPSIADLSLSSLTVGASYDQSEVTAIAAAVEDASNKIDELLTAMRAAEMLE